MNIKTAVAPQENVPNPHPRAQSAHNFIQSRNTGATVIGFTECWHFRTRLAIRNQFKKQGWGVYAPRGSQVIVWDQAHWTLISSRVIKGHAAIRKVSDTRNIVVVQLKSKEGVYIDFYVVHPCPIPTVKAPKMVPAANRAHLVYYDNLLNDLRVRTRPAVVLGDWNTSGRPLGTSVNGREIKYRHGDTDKIIQVAHVDGKGLKWYASTKAEQDQKYSDHTLLIVERLLS